jgi:hypothetical protein
MLGRKNYTKEEYENAAAAVARQIAAYKKIVKLAGGADKKASATVDDFEAVYFNNMVLVLDRYFVHRIRPVTGKDTNPLNEVELIADALVNNGGVLQTNKVIKYVVDDSVLALQPGDPIKVSVAQFERLSTAFLDELKRRFL